MNKQHEDASKFLSYVLRHKPDSISLPLDSEGWANISQLIKLANGHGKKLNLTLLQDTVALNDKKRFSISSDGLKIRANQGHSLQVDLNLQPQTPPKILFHGTATRFINSINHQGLIARSRQFVHLSIDRITSRQVGKRHGEPITLEVDAFAMSIDKFEFYISENGIWLTSSVPKKYLKFSES